MFRYDSVSVRDILYSREGRHATKAAVMVLKHKLHECTKKERNKNNFETKTKIRDIEYVAACNVLSLYKSLPETPSVIFDRIKKIISHVALIIPMVLVEIAGKLKYNRCMNNRNIICCINFKDDVSQFNFRVWKLLDFDSGFKGNYSSWPSWQLASIGSEIGLAPTRR